MCIYNPHENVDKIFVFIQFFQNRQIISWKFSKNEQMTLDWIRNE